MRGTARCIISDWWCIKLWVIASLGSVQVCCGFLWCHATDKSQRSIGGNVLLEAMHYNTVHRFSNVIKSSIKKEKKTYMFHAVWHENLWRILIWSQRGFHLHSCSSLLLLHRHPSLMTLRPASDDPSSGWSPAQNPQFDTPQASKKTQNSIHNLSYCHVFVTPSVRPSVCPLQSTNQ